jgi:hypothetical protein
MRRRYSGPWSPNPWINAAIVGSQEREVDADSRPAMVAIEYDRAAAQDSRTAEQHGAADQRQQKAATGVCEDEGGSTAAPWKV